MASIGDRVVFEGIMVGGARREGELVFIQGRAVRVRWEDGSESLMFPGPGAMTVVENSRSSSKKKPPAKKVAAKKPAAKTKSKKR